LALSTQYLILKNCKKEAMRFSIPLLFLFLIACSTEDKVGPVQATTFVRYFNGGGSDDAQALLQTSDGGYIILANTGIKPSELVDTHFKIKLIKTDAFGNQLWQKFFPEFGNDTNPAGSKLSYKGNGIEILKDGGYVIAGEDIQNGVSQLMIMTVDSEGSNPAYKTIKSATPMSGVAVAANSNGDFLALGSIPSASELKNMVLCKFSKSSLDSSWLGTYGAGSVTLANKLFLDSRDNAYWGGTVQRENTNSAIRFVKIVTDPSNLGGIDFDLPLSKPGITETGNDFCSYGAGFAIIGTTNEKKSGGTGDLDILFKRISENGTELSSESFPIEGQDQNEVGNSICTTRDGGLLLLSTIDSQGELGRGDKDFYLIKIDPFGELAWSQAYGSKFEDVGVSVIPASDGGYVILGTTTLSRVKTVTLMKVDKNGKIE